jgi:glycolate oxidase
VNQVRQLLLDQGATEVRTARDEAERIRFWQGRKSAFPAVGRISPDYYCMDGTVPRRRLAEVLTSIGALSESYELPVANMFHAGDGNLHPLILFDANNPGELKRAENLGAEILELCGKQFIDWGGAQRWLVSDAPPETVRRLAQQRGGHAALFRRGDRCGERFHALSPPLMEIHRNLKHAFDPAGIFNPGRLYQGL